MTLVMDTLRPQSLDLRGALATLIDGHEDAVPVREEIGASWQRSAATGLRPDRLDVPFDPEVDGDGLLARAGRPVLDQLAAELSDARVGVLLTDDRGHVVDRRVADASLNARLDRILLAPGFVYGEDVVGTNGIGTALALRAPALVRGDEHFSDALTGMACAGAPIFDLRSAHLLGVIDLTSLTVNASPLMLPLAIRAARDIEQQILDDAGLSERLVLHRFLQRRSGAKGPLVFLSARTMIANAAASRFVHADDEGLLRDHARRAGSGPTERLGPVELSSGTTVTVEREALMDGGQSVGSLLRLKPMTGDRTVPSRTHDGHPAFGWESLTDTERTVTELVAQGLTNREAGERVFLSHHTVGFHLRSVFAKLGVSSRVELTRVALQRGVHPEHEG
jgi:transcriptional regulator of acetoin/glycerol metabolism/DNA-binding CsgD family transcriptional regulator